VKSDETFLNVTVVDTTTQLQNYGFEKINIYPNPVSDYLVIELENYTKSSCVVTLTDIYGSQSFQKEFELTGNNNILRMNIPDLLYGMYIICIDNQYFLFKSKNIY